MATKKRLRIASYNINGINSRLHVLTRWLEEFKGGERTAPNEPGAARYPALEAAPGRYVKQRAS